MNQTASSAANSSRLSGVRRATIFIVNALVLLWFVDLLVTAARVRGLSFNFFSSLLRWGAIDWLYFAVPFLGLVTTIVRPRFAALVSIGLYTFAFLFFLACLLFAILGVPGFSEAEHLIIFLIGRGVPALLITGFIFLVARFTGGVLPTRENSHDN